MEIKGLPTYDLYSKFWKLQVRLRMHASELG